MEIPKDQVSKYELPNELWLEIFEYLSFKDLLNIKLVSKHWLDLAQSASVLNRMTLVIDRHNWDNLSESLCLRNLGYKSVRMEAVNLTHVDFTILENLGSNVTHLIIRYCSILDQSWNKKLFPNVEFLQIDNTSLRHPKSLCFASSKLKRLHIDLCENSSAMNAVSLIESISETIMELKLDMYPDLGLLQSHIARAFGSIKNLEVLDINEFVRCGVLEKILESLSERNNLKKLTISALAMDDDILKSIITKWSHTLRKVTFHKPIGISNSGIVQLNQLKETLTYLHLSGCNAITGEGIVHGIAETTNKVLRSLRLWFIPNIDDIHLCMLCERLSNLRELSVEYCDKTITTNSIKSITKHLSQLEILNLTLCVDDEIVVPFNHLNRPSLKVLHIENIHSSQEKLHIEQFVQWHSGLEELNLSGCAILTDECIFVIATQLKQLRYLDISVCENLTERSVEYVLRHCEYLKELRIACMNFWLTLNGIENELLKSKPDFKIITEVEFKYNR